VPGRVGGFVFSSRPFKGRLCEGVMDDAVGHL